MTSKSRDDDIRSAKSKESKEARRAKMVSAYVIEAVGKASQGRSRSRK